MYKILLIGHKYHLTKYMKGFYDALLKRFDLRFLFVDDYWPSSMDDIAEYRNYDACIWYVRFRELIEKPAFNWKDFTGIRVMYDEDAHQNFHFMVDKNPYLGKWPVVYNQNEFHTLICTGRQTRDALISEGVKAYWLPKAYDPTRLFDKKIERKGIGYFGELYSSRRAMLHYLKRNNLKFSYFHCSDQKLNDELNKYIGCLICNMAGKVKPGIWGLINHYYPSRGIDLRPGFEPMLKNFEVPGAGCAPIADWIDELKELGFEDGRTMVSYHTFKELTEKLQHYQRNPDKMRNIGNRAYTLAREQHTWDHRVEQLQRILFPTSK
jgi:hypothetical protein